MERGIQSPPPGEPLALDLVNTTWPDGEGWRDVLANRSGHEQWLRENDLPGPSTAAARRALLQARDTITAALERPGPAALAALDGILERGCLRIWATNLGEREELEIEREWRVPWLAVRSLLRLLDEHPARVRNCESRLSVLVPRHHAVRNAPLVLHDRLREPPQGPTPLPAGASRLTAGVRSSGLISDHGRRPVRA